MRLDKSGTRALTEAQHTSGEEIKHENVLLWSVSVSEEGRRGMRSLTLPPCGRFPCAELKGTTYDLSNILSKTALWIYNSSSSIMYVNIAQRDFGHTITDCEEKDSF